MNAGPFRETSLEALAVHLALGLALVLVMDYVGSKSIRVGYVNFSKIMSSDAVGFNVVLRVLTPPIFLAASSATLYWLRLGGLVKNIWLSALYYWIVFLLINIVLNRFELMDTRLYVGVAAASVATTYYFYNTVYAKGLDFILPGGQAAMFQFWVVAAVYAYTLLQKVKPTEPSVDSRKDVILRRCNVFRNKYDRLLNDQFRQDAVLQDLLFAFMIFEDFQRPIVVRALERLLARAGRARTTGIMQVESDRDLSDDESVMEAQDLISSLYADYLESREHELESLRAELEQEGVEEDELLEEEEDGHDIAYEVYKEYSGGYQDDPAEIFEILHDRRRREEGLAREAS